MPQTILVTGTNRGLGLEFVKQLLCRGDHVFATCRKPAHAPELQQLAQTFSNLRVLPLDVADTDTFTAFAESLPDQPLDVFINNAGVYGPKGLRWGSVQREDWMQTLLVNTVAPLLLTQALVGTFRADGPKKLVYLSSKVGSIAENDSGGGYIYRSSKTALNQVIKSLSLDLAGQGFKALALHPGWVLTDMGGPNALIEPHTSVEGMLRVIDNLTPEQSGSFLNYDGSPIPW
jgi:NAD(P)-dependent dehydrogenase (short-subunit alcohol dehydrogenase family)